MVSGNIFQAPGECAQDNSVFPVSRTIDDAGATAGQRRKLAAGSGPYLVDDTSRMPGMQEAAVCRTAGTVGEALHAEPVLYGVYGLPQCPCDFGKQLQFDDRIIMPAAIAAAATDERYEDVVFPAVDHLVRMEMGRHVHLLILP
jgi:hypothetical protein